MRITDDINQIINHLRKGKIVAVPTESNYKLIAIASTPNIEQKLFRTKKKSLKHRPSFVFLNYNSLKKFITPTKYFEKILPFLTPGNIKFLVKGNKLIAKNRTFYAQITNNETLLTILKRIKKPLITTSANIHRMPHSTTVDEVVEYFKDSIDLIYEKQQKMYGVSATVLDCTKERSITLLKKGLVNIDEIDNFIPKEIELKHDLQNKKIKLKNYNIYRIEVKPQTTKKSIVLGTKENLKKTFNLESVGFFHEFEIDNFILINLGCSGNNQSIAKNLNSNLAKIYKIKPENVYLLWQKWGSDTFAQAVENTLLNYSLKIDNSFYLENKKFRPNRFFLERLLGRQLEL